jgi:hypothetical protein
MDVQEIEVTIDKDGQVRIHVMGIKGDACLDLTHELELALGGVVVEREMTPEALEQPDHTDESLHMKGGL